MYKYRCIHLSCNAYIRIQKSELDKLSHENLKNNVNYTFYNEHTQHKGSEINISIDDIKTLKQTDSLAVNLIKKILQNL